MGTFLLGKERDDLTAAILLPEDWYTFEISQDVTEEKNAKWKEGGKDLPAEQIEGAGKNLVVRGRIVSDEPEFNGRSFTKWLALPNPSDKGLFMQNGQPKEDWKLDQVYKWVEAFAGTVEGASVSLAVGMKAQIYVEQGWDRNDSSIPVNNLGFIDPRPLGQGGLDGLDDIPF